MQKFTRSLTPFLKRFAQDEGGNIIIMFGLAVVFLVAIAGAAIDLGQQQALKVHDQQSADAAAVSAGTLTDNGVVLTDAQVKDAGSRYFLMNHPEMVSSPPLVTTTQSGGKLGQITVASQTQSVTTSFVKSFGVTRLDASGSSTVQAAISTSTNYDVLLVLDNSGSMCATPSTSTINPGWHCAGDANTGTSKTDARIYALQSAADTMIQNLLGDNTQNNQIGYILWDDTLIDSGSPTDNSALIRSKVDNMYSRVFNPALAGATDSRKGMGQAQQMLSTFRDGTVHAVVLLTDGVNFSAGQNFVYQGHTYCCTPGSAQPGWNAETITICQALKDKNVKIYTIAFGADVSQGNDASTVRNFLEQCASGTAGLNGGEAGSTQAQYFFLAPDKAALDKVFTAITTQVQNLRITK